MFGSIGKLLSTWSTSEPVASLLLLVAAVLLMGVTYARLGQETTRKYRFLIALGYAVIFAGTVLAFYFLLTSNLSTFKESANALAGGGTLAMKERAKAQRAWGGGIYQQEIVVEHFVERQVVSEVRGPEGKTLYINKTLTENVPQDSIDAFAGQADIHVVDGDLGTFLVTARYEYTISNHSDQITRAEYEFPLPNGKLYQKFSVLVNGRQVEDYVVSNRSVTWHTKMQPGQQDMIVVSYVARGDFVYQYNLSDQRNVKNFSLAATLDTKDFNVQYLPRSERIKFESIPTETGYNLDLKIDQAILSPQFRVTLRSKLRAELDYKQVVYLLEPTPRALVLLGVVSMMTLIICGVAVDLRRFFLTTAVFYTQFLALMGFGLLMDYRFVVVFILAGALGLTYLVLHKLPRLPRTLILVSTALFTLAYPLSGLLGDSAQKNSFESIVLVVILVYFFGLALYLRIRKAVSLKA